MKKYLIILLVMLTFISALFSQPVQVNQDENPVYVEQTTPQDNVKDMLVDGISQILAGGAIILLGWVLALVNKYLNIKIMSSRVIGIITRKAESIDYQPRSNDEKREITARHLLQTDKKAAKWANILYGGLEEAVSVVYKTIVKKAIKGLS